MGRPMDCEKHRYGGTQLSAWRKRGLTQVEFCRRQGMGRRLFCSWKRRLEPAQGSPPPQARFDAVAIRPEAEATTKRAAAASTALTVVTSSGYRIEVGEGFVPQTLARLLTTLGQP
jgi:hypothetical protein